MDPRQEKGMQIARTNRLRKKGKVWIVPSQTHSGSYVVEYSKSPTCTCPDFETRGCRCKHIYAVAFVKYSVTRPDGTVETTTLRATYSQDWPAYNAGQMQEKKLVESLLSGLCDGIVQPPQVGRGRPRLPFSDIVYGNVMKVYSTWSGRRASTDIRECREKGHITSSPHYNTLFLHMEQPELTPLLKVLIEESAEPLKAIETTFAVDATGFSTTTYDPCLSG